MWSTGSTYFTITAPPSANQQSIWKNELLVGSLIQVCWSSPWPSPSTYFPALQRVAILRWSWWPMELWSGAGTGSPKSWNRTAMGSDGGWIWMDWATFDKKREKDIKPGQRSHGFGISMELSYFQRYLSISCWVMICSLGVVCYFRFVSQWCCHSVAIMSQKDPLVIEHGYGKWQFSS